LNSQNFHKKVPKKVRKFKFGKVRILTKIVRQLQNPVFESKKPVFGSKSSEKFGKSLEKVWKSSETGFSECTEFTEISDIDCSIPNSPKITKKLC